MFDFDKSLERLANYARIGVLDAGAKLEMMFLRDQPTLDLTQRRDILYSSVDTLIADRVSEQIMEKYKISTDSKTPTHVTADGNCLFNALSVGLVGNESLASELRVRTCLELLKNRRSYETKYHSLHLVCPAYEDVCKAAATKGMYSSAWTMVAAANVIGYPIQSVYPPRNGMLDHTIGILNTLFTPMYFSQGSDPIIILWTSTCQSFTNTWLPNHFVPMIENSKADIVDLDSFDDFPPLNSTVISESRNEIPTIFDETVILGSPEISEMPILQERPLVFSSPCNDNLLHENSNRSDFPESSVQSSGENRLQASEHDSTKNAEVHSELNEIQSGVRKLSKEKFLDTDNVLELIISSEEDDILAETPRGKKENIFFLLDQKENLDRRSRSKKMEFWDDCGTWDSKSSSTKTTYFVYVEGKLVSVVKKETLYCKEIKKKFVPLASQPLQCELVILKRFYATLKRDKTYKKRISWFQQLPGHPKHCETIAVAEYLGVFPKETISKHGNARKTNQEYIRSSPKTKENILEAVKSEKTVKEIFKQHFDSEHQPRDSKMIKNLKEKVKRETNPGYQRNTADDIQAVLNMTAVQNPFVREIVQTSGKPPNIICYTDNQLKHVVKASKTSVIGIDRTFNLGACFLTTTVFQDQNLRQKGKEVSPILLGPLYLHWDGTFHTYQRFFSHLASVMENSDLKTSLGTNNLVIGSDEEKALVKAVQHSFPQAKLTLCTRHLEENLKRHLKNKVGMPENESKNVVRDVFGSDGLTNLNSSVLFVEKSSELERKYRETVGNYLTEKLIPSIRKFIHDVSKNDGRIPLNWKNNNCEAMNHILKLNLNWKPAKIPDLINMLYNEINLQEALIRGALYSREDYELSDEAACLKIPLSTWQQKTEAEKALLYKRFLSFGQRQLVCTTVASSDGKLLIPKTSNLAKKLAKDESGQEKR